MDGARREPAPGSRRVRRARVAAFSTARCSRQAPPTVRSAPSPRSPIARRFGDTDLEFDALALLGECYVATRPGGGGHEAARRGDGRRDRRGGHGPRSDRRDLLPPPQRVRARDGRAASRAVDGHHPAAPWRGPTSCVPTCRSHYGGILVALGRWEEAETELLDAIETFKRGYRGDSSLPLMRLADLRVRQGRYEEAERLLEGADWHPAARRATATIALARGDLALAEELAQLCMEGADPADPGCAPLLALLIEIQLGRDERRRGRADARPPPDACRERGRRAGDGPAPALAGPRGGRGGRRAGDRRPEEGARRHVRAEPPARGRAGAPGAGPRDGSADRRTRPRRRRGSRFAPSSASARRATRTRRRRCCASWARVDGRGVGRTAR